MTLFEKHLQFIKEIGINLIQRMFHITRVSCMQNLATSRHTPARQMAGEWRGATHSETEALYHVQNVQVSDSCPFWRITVPGLSVLTHLGLD